jgi:hypothetical protein
MQVRHLVRRSAYLLGLALFLIGPLLYLNVDLIRQGFKPSRAGLHIEADRGRFESDVYTLPAEDE